MSLSNIHFSFRSCVYPCFSPVILIQCSSWRLDCSLYGFGSFSFVLSLKFFFLVPLLCFFFHLWLESLQLLMLNFLFLFEALSSAAFGVSFSSSTLSSLRRSPDRRDPLDLVLTFWLLILPCHSCSPKHLQLSLRCLDAAQISVAACWL